MKSFKTTFLFVPLTFLLFGEFTSATNLSTTSRQTVSCTTDADCNVGFIFPFLECVSGTCRAPPPPEFSIEALTLASVPRGVEGRCTSFRDCASGLVCISGNPVGTCGNPEGVVGLSHLIVNLIQEDYTPGTEADSSPQTEPSPTQPTPLRTSRAIAIIYLAVHDTYGLLTGEFRPKITSQVVRRSAPAIPRSFNNNSRSSASQVEGTALIAGFTAARLLYPESVDRINAVQERAAGDIISVLASFGKLVGEAWVAVRRNDGSAKPLTDDSFALGQFLRHQPDPNFPGVRPGAGAQNNLGRFWGRVRPFILRDVRRQAFLKKFPSPKTTEYRDNLEEVTEKGQCNNIMQDGVPIQDIGLFWGYDSVPMIGVPPRLYLQVVLAVQELNSLSFKEQLRAFSAVGASMADAGIAAWFWKFFYDLWRPVLGIREDRISPNTSWSPRGIGLTNFVTSRGADEKPPSCRGINPNFPAYPSGHASFGTAAFSVLSKLLGKRPEDIIVTFTSDEFNGISFEGTTGERRDVFRQTITLQQAIQQNLDSRVFIGVHWRFDSEGGAVIGEQVADIVAKEFAF